MDGGGLRKAVLRRAPALLARADVQCLAQGATLTPEQAIELALPI